MKQIVRALCLGTVLVNVIPSGHSQYATPPISNTELETSPGTIGGGTPAPNPSTVTNVAPTTLTNLSQVGTTTGGIRGGTPSDVPTAVTTIRAGADLGRPAPVIARSIPKGDVRIELQLLADGLIAPLGISAPNDGSGRLFVYDQAGLVWSIDQNTGATNVLLDVRDRLVPLMPGYDERGLLGFTVHSNFAAHPLVYTYTTEPVSGQADFTLPRPADRQFDHQNVIAEWRIDPANSNRVDVASRREILRIDHPQFNHSAGTLRFGPDGYLYFSLGDGGGADDQDGQPFLGQLVWGHGSTGNGQNIETLHGSILRISVDANNATNGKYGIPVDNPFVGGPGVDEIYAYGFRNPYSFSFDRSTGQLYVGDAGQNSVEEINRVVKGGNHGWNLKEGSFFFEPGGAGVGYITNVSTRVSAITNLVNPVAEFDHDEGRVVVGGFVYRGTSVPALTGKYVASIFAMENEPYSRIIYFDVGATNTTSQSALMEIRIGLEDRRPEVLVRGFGEDAQGELYVLGSNEIGPMGTSGKVYRVVNPPPMIVVTNNSRMVVTNGATTVTNLSVAWEGGLGPFGVEQKITLSDVFWNLPLLTTNREATVIGDGPGSVLRITEKPHVVTTGFTALLGGTNVRPTAVETSASGLGLFLLEGNELTYMLMYSNLTSTATVANIHGPAFPEQTGPAIIGLQPFGGILTNSGVFVGAVMLDDHQRLALLNGQGYVSVDTLDLPEGEIRGHLVPAALASPLRGAHERPIPVHTPAFGNALMALLGNKLTFVVNYQGLSTPAVAAHIHGPAGHEDAAPPLVDLTPFLSNPNTNGTIAGTVLLTSEQVNYIAGARTYINVHSQDFPDGEIRGHVYLVPGVVPMTVFLSGQAERPSPVETPAGGFGLLAVAGNRVMFEMAYTNLTGLPTAAHFHGPATVDEAAPPVVDLAAFTIPTTLSSGFISGMLDLPLNVAVDMLNVRTYVNVHTTNHPAGEIRSQVAPVLTKASLSGAAERPTPVQTPATGAGLQVLVGNQLNVHVAFGNLTAPAIGAYIHGPATPSTAADVLMPLTPLFLAQSGTIVQTIPLTVDQWNLMISGRTYISIHIIPEGEIRGNILP